MQEPAALDHVQGGWDQIDGFSSLIKEGKVSQQEVACGEVVDAQ